MSVSLFIRDLFGISEQKSQVIDDQDFVIIDEPVSALPLDKQQQLIDKVKELFSETIREEVVYTADELASCGQLNRSGSLIPFTNYNTDVPHSYQSNMAAREGEGTYHIRLASAIIQSSLGVEKGKTSLQLLQSRIATGDKKALQVAAVLKQIGDSLSPLPNDPQINMSLMEREGCVTYDPTQKGTIHFYNLNSADRVMRFVVSREVIDIKDLEGTKIGSFIGQRVISVHQPNRDGQVKCVIEREYLPHLLTVNKGGI